MLSLSFPFLFSFPLSSFVIISFFSFFLFCLQFCFFICLFDFLSSFFEKRSHNIDYFASLECCIQAMVASNSLRSSYITYDGKVNSSVFNFQKTFIVLLEYCTWML